MKRSLPAAAFCVEIAVAAVAQAGELSPVVHNCRVDVSRLKAQCDSSHAIYN